MYIYKKQTDYKIFGLIIFSISTIETENQPRDVIFTSEEDDDDG